MTNTASEITNWSFIVTDLIELTQTGKLDWRPGQSDGEYLAEFNRQTLKLVDPPVNDTLPSIFGSRVITYPHENVRLEVIIDGRSQIRFPSLPALGGLAIAVERYSFRKAQTFFDAVHNAVKTGK